MAYHPFRNLGLKALSVGLAVLVWLVVLGEHVVERGLRVPLEFRNIPESLEIVGAPPQTVDVRVRGTSGLLGRLQPGDVVAVLDLNAARPGSRLLSLRTDQVRAPFGVEVAQIVPAAVALDLERSSSRVVPVVPAVDGQPAPGFVLGTVRVEPSTVEVIGPESRLERITSATTETVRLDGASASVTDVVTIGVGDASLRLRQPQTAVVVAEIVPAPMTRVLPDVPVRLRNMGSGLRARAEPVSVTVGLRGSRDDLSRLAADAVIAFVDLAGLGPGQYNLPVRIDPPRDFGISDIKPTSATVIIR